MAIETAGGLRFAASYVNAGPLEYEDIDVTSMLVEEHNSRCFLGESLVTNFKEMHDAESVAETCNAIIEIYKAINMSDNELVWLYVADEYNATHGQRNGFWIKRNVRRK